jgi:hypothetical protein
MLTRTRRPNARSVIALPDCLKYRDLFRETAGSLAECGIEVWWVSQSGDVTETNLHKQQRTVVASIPPPDELARTRGLPMALAVAGRAAD